MNKFISILLICFCFTDAMGNTPMRVIGSGINLTQAREDGFKQAIERYVGTILVSQRQHYNQHTIKNEVLVHSSGFVSHYNIIDSYVENKVFYVTMDVYVNSSKIANRILTNMPTPQLVDGYNASAGYKTAVQAQRSWNNIVQLVMNDYPRLAFNIEQSPAYTSLSDRNTLLLHVPYQLSWNLNYLQAFEEILSQVSDGLGGMFTPRNYSQFSFIGGSNNSYMFINRSKSYSLQKMMLNNKHPQLFVSLKSLDGQILSNVCAKIEGSSTMLYNLGDPSYMSIFVKNKFKGKVTLEFEYLPEDFYEVDLQVLPYKQCVELAKNRV